MECPKCGVDGRVALAEERDGELVRHYICPNPRCAMYRQEIGESSWPVNNGTKRQTSRFGINALTGAETLATDQWREGVQHG